MTIGRIKKPILVIMTSLTLILGTFALVLPYPEAEAAQALACPPNITAGGPFGNVVVTAGPACEINGVTIQGNVRVAKDAVFNCRNGAIIEGNVQARGAAIVDLEECTINGNVSILNGDIAAIADTSIDGKLTLRGNSSVLLDGVTVGGLATCARNANEFVIAPNIYNGGNKDCPVA
jgi:hypothetical protein